MVILSSHRDCSLQTTAKQVTVHKSTFLCIQNQSQLTHLLGPKSLRKSPNPLRLNHQYMSLSNLNKIRVFRCKFHHSNQTKYSNSTPRNLHKNHQTLLAKVKVFSDCLRYQLQCRNSSSSRSTRMCTHNRHQYSIEIHFPNFLNRGWLN